MKSVAVAPQSQSIINTSDFLLWCSRVNINGLDSFVSSGNIAEFDWVYFLEQVSYHRLVPVVYENLKVLPNGFVPEEVLENLEKTNSINKRRILRLNFELLKIARLLDSQKIRTIFFKGPTLSQLAYGSLDKRMFDDLDILTQNDDYLKPREILLKQGYFSLDYPTLSSEKSNKFRHYAGEYTLVHEKGQICLDIHNRLLGGGSLGFSKPFSRIWDRLICVRISNQELNTLCPEDLLIYLSLNGLKDGWESIRAVCDVDRLVRNCRINWELVIDEAERTYTSRALFVSLFISRRLLKTPFPEKIDSILEEEHYAEGIANNICYLISQQIDQGIQRNPITTFKIMWMTLSTRKDRWMYLSGIPKRTWNLLTTVNSHDTEILSLPKPLLFLYYPVRIFRVVKNHGFNIFKVLFK